MKEELEKMSDAIEAVFKAHRICARVTGGTVTPRFIEFIAIPEIGQKIGAVKAVRAEIAAALNVRSPTIDQRGAVVAIRVDRKDKSPVHLLALLKDAEEEGLCEYMTVLGIAADGVPLCWSLKSPSTPHAMVAGTTGSGKTVLLRSIILGLAISTHEANLKMILIDPKASDGVGAFNALWSLPHLSRPVIWTQDEAIEALQSTIRLMEREQAAARPFRVLIVVDELFDLLASGPRSDEVVALLQRLLQRGREAGIHLLLSTQKPTSDVLGPLMKANVPLRICGAVTSATDSRVATGIAGAGAERLGDVGEFICVCRNDVIVLIGALVTEKDISRVCSEYGWTNRKEPNMKAETQSKTVFRIPSAPPRPVSEVDVKYSEDTIIERLSRARWAPDGPVSYRSAAHALRNHGWDYPASGGGGRKEDFQRGVDAYLKSIDMI